MKTSAFILIISLFLFSCTKDELSSIENSLPNVTEFSSHRITESDAIVMANKIFKETRGTSLYDIKHVISKEKAKTRISGVSDTLAYIINRNNNNGFIIVSSDDRVFPILAYSDNGTFSYEEDMNNVVYANFISLLDEYMASINEDDTTVVIPADYPSSCVVRNNGHAITWDQQGLFSKYVTMEHPNSPVGCVALTTAQLMTYCSDTLTYRGVLYHFDAIRNAMKKQKDPNAQMEPTIGNLEIPYTEAIDSIAKILYLLGIDLHMNYVQGEPSYTSSFYALNFLKDMGYYIEQEKYHLDNYNDSIVMGYLLDDFLIYMDGRNLLDLGGTGHAWLIDGGRYCYETFDSNIIGRGIGMRNIEFHCDWGWGGMCNGYFSGNVFAVRDFEFGRMKFFAVAKE